MFICLSVTISFNYKVYANQDNLYTESLINTEVIDVNDSEIDNKNIENSDKMNDINNINGKVLSQESIINFNDYTKNLPYVISFNPIKEEIPEEIKNLGQNKNNSSINNTQDTQVSNTANEHTDDVIKNTEDAISEQVSTIIIKPHKTLEEKEEFVNTMYEIGKAHEVETGIPAALFTAQACYESYYGSSNYAVYKNNLFGFIGYTFNSPEESIAAYEKTLNGNRYNHLIGKTLEEWVYGIGPAGYCDSATYGDGLWNVIKMWKLDTRE